MPIKCTEMRARETKQSWCAMVLKLNELHGMKYATEMKRSQRTTTVRYFLGTDISSKTLTVVECIEFCDHDASDEC